MDAPSSETSILNRCPHVEAVVATDQVGQDLKIKSVFTEVYFMDSKDFASAPERAFL